MSQPVAASQQISDAILEVRDVGFAYGGVWAVKNCSFAVQRGAITGLIGPNGAGKSTCLEIVSGTLAPRSGAVLFEGQEINGWGAARVARAGISRTFQTPHVLGRLPVIENVMVAGPEQLGENPVRALFRRGTWRKQEASLRDEASAMLEWLGLGDHMYRQAGTLSGGQRKLLELARALMARPKLLLLDEPTAGVFPELSLLIADRIRETAARGVTVLVIAHNMNFLASVAEDVVVMGEGRVLIRGPLEEVSRDADVIAAYLGVPKVLPEQELLGSNGSHATSAAQAYGAAE